MAERALLHRFEQAGPLTWLLAALAGWAMLLLMAAVLGMGSAVQPTPRIAAVGTLPQAKPASPDRIGPLSQYAEAASRPVFTSDRRPRSFLAMGPDGDAAAAAQSQSLDFILTGVLISPQLRMAFLQPTGGGVSIRVREGASPEGAPGWRLVDVQPRRAIFAGNGGESGLDLRVFGDDPLAVKSSIAIGNVSASEGATDVAAADAAAAAVAAGASQDAANAAPVPLSDAARIELIRKRIEARRAQLQNQTQSNTAPTPLSAPPRQ